MRPINLTEGAISMLFTGDALETDVKPVLQVAEITLVKTRNQNSNIERYRIWLSDGMFSQQGMLDQQLNDLVRSDTIQKGSIVQLNNFVLDVIKNSWIILIIGLDVLHKKCERIGEPMLFKTEGNSYSMTRTLAPVQTVSISPHSDATGSVMDGSWPNVASEVHVLSTGMVAKRGPIAQKEGPPGIIPPAALNPVEKAFNQQFHFCPLSDLEGTENNSIVDVIGVVSFISPSSSARTKFGTEIQKRTLQLNDTSGRSVELTLWDKLCNVEGQKLQFFCDSRKFPILAVKSCRVRDFYGKVVCTTSTSQLFIDPDFPEARHLKAWFDNEGKNANSISISRFPNMVRPEKAEKVNFQTETKYDLDSIAKFKMEDSGSVHLESREYAAPTMIRSRNTANMNRESDVSSQPGSYNNQYNGSRLPMTGSTSMYTSPENCPSPSTVNGLDRGSFGYGASPWVTSSGETLKCFKCHLFGHWARDCPGFLQ